MTSIEKLSIRGIRAFSPKDSAIIQFDKPLTLIVGPNGSGKTTIIECLKMACTGDLPPNCKSGQAFINDPSLHEQAEVKAQIRLKFTSLNGQPVVCVRSFSLTQKPTKKEYKAFEAALQTLDEQGIKKILSYKCADLNKLVPEMMGVSQAVLESVVFVHQEESCWPLAEDKVLKDKFDAIFASTQFTKALDEINKLKKSRRNDEKVLNAERGELDERLRSANRLRQEEEMALLELEQTNHLIATRRDEMEGLRAQLQPLLATCAEKSKLRAREQELDVEHRHALTRRAEAKRKLGQAYGRELDEATKELEQTVNNLRHTDAPLRDEIRKMEVTRITVEKDVSVLDSEREESRANLSRLQAAEDTMKRTETEALNFIHLLGNRYDLTAAVGGASAAGKVEASLEIGEKAHAIVQQQLKTRQQSLISAKSQWHAHISAKQQALSEVRAQIASATREAEAKKRLAETQDAKHKEVSSKLKTLNADEARLHKARREAAVLQQELRDQEADLSREDEAVRLAEKKREVRELKDRQRSLMEELSMANAESGLRSTAERLKKLAQEQNEKFESLLTAKLERILGVHDLVSDLQTGYINKRQQNVRRTLEDASRKAEEHVDSLQRESNALSGKIAAAKSMLAQKKVEEGELTATLAAQDPRYVAVEFDFDRHVVELEHELRSCRDAAPVSTKTMLQVLDMNLAHAVKAGTCKFCDQQCGALQVEKMRQNRQRYFAAARDGANVSVEGQRIIINAERALSDATKAAEVSRRLKVIRDVQLSDLEREVVSHKSGADRLDRQLEEAKAARAKARDAEAEAADARADVTTLKAAYDEKMKVDEERDRAISALTSSAAVHGVVRSLESIRSEMEDLAGEVDRAERSCDALEKQARLKLAERDETARRKTMKDGEIAKLEADARMRESVQEQLEELVQQQTAIARERGEIERNEVPLRERESDLRSEIESAQEKEKIEVGEADERVVEAQTDASKLGEFVGRLREYKQKGLGELAARAKRTFENASQKLDEMRARHEQLKADLQDREGKLTRKERMVAEIDANIEYRTYAAREVELAKELEAIRLEIETLPNANGIEASIGKIEAALRAKEMEEQKNLGSVETHTARLKDTRAQLNDSRFRQIDEKCAEKNTEHYLCTLAMGDLDRYYKALDRSMIRFHQTMMEEINRSAKELWNKTYKGTDIDGIEIKSEHEGYTDAGARRHSYRVMMRKGDNLLDMRGRCSAGQRVLACLIIRLALAESFCINCGILALDEPTTNLDTANAEAFASALHDVIEHRKSQSNFQLIVITHDEKFVKSIGASGYCNHYYRVAKRLTTGEVHSTIEQVPIAQFD